MITNSKSRKSSRLATVINVSVLSLFITAECLYNIIQVYDLENKGKGKETIWTLCCCCCCFFAGRFFLRAMRISGFDGGICNLWNHVCFPTKSLTIFTGNFAIVMNGNVNHIMYYWNVGYVVASWLRCKKIQVLGCGWYYLNLVLHISQR